MKTYDNRPIGVFDSGIGGLTVVTAMTELLPNERFIYFGDTARTPYGSKSIETIKEFSAQVYDFLVRNEVKMVVIACNTVSATCIEFLRKRHEGMPIIGMIAPTAREIVKRFGKESNVGVIGTKVTVESQQYEKSISKINGKCKVFSKACPLFVPMIEEGIKTSNILEPVIKYYLDDFIKVNSIDTIVLGCTHYPLLKNEIERIYPEIKIINPSRIVAEEVKLCLFDNNMLSLCEDKKSLFYASDLSNEFLNMATNICSTQNKKIECIELKI